MTVVDDVNKLIEQYRLTVSEFCKGNPEPYKAMLPHRKDVTLATPICPPVHGWEQVAATMEHAAS